MTTQAAAAETGGDEGADVAKQELEGRARRMGWRPQDEFRGPADAWVDADVFIDRTMAEAPFLRERNRFLDDHLVKQQRETARLAKVVSEQGEYIKANLGEIRDRGRRAEAGAFERHRVSIKAAIKAAGKSGDDAEVDRLTDELVSLESNRPNPVEEEEEPKTPAQPERRAPTVEEVEQQISPTTKAWINRPANSWFKTDPVLNGVAVMMHGANVQSGMSEEDSLESVSKEIRRRYADKFENERREVPPTVHQPAPPGSTGKPKGKTVNDLPPEAQAVLAQLKRLMPTYTDAEYLGEYKW